MQDKIDFSSLERITPKKDSFAKVLYRLDSQQKRLISFTRYTRIALAASFLFIVGGLTLPKLFTENISPAEYAENPFEWEEESFVLQLETLDSSLSISYLLTEDN